MNLYEPSEWPDIAAAVDTPSEVLSERLGLTVAQADEVLKWHQSEAIANEGELLHTVLEFLTASTEGDSILDSGMHSKATRAQKANRISRRVTVRTLSAVFVLAPELLGGIAQMEIAKRLCVSRALISYWSIQFATRFKIHSRGLKSKESRAIFSRAQLGNHNRNKNHKPKNKT